MKNLSVALLLFVSCSYSLKESRRNIRMEDSRLFEYTYDGSNLISKIEVGSDSIKKDGIALYYSDNFLSRSMYYSNDTLTGSYTEYFPNGDIKLFLTYDSFGDTVFLRQYDTSNKIIKEEGDRFPVTGQSGSDIQKNESKNVIFIPNVPYSSIDVTNYYVSKDGDTIKPYKLIIERGWEYYYYFIIPKQGEYSYFQRILIADSTKKEGYVVKDTFNVSFSW